MTNTKNIEEKLEEINKKLTMLLIIEARKMGLTSEEIGKMLGVAGSTVRTLVPLSKFKGAKNDEKEKKGK
jgi:DNA-directed RNA polymerase specialized sigma24 family protein